MQTIDKDIINLISTLDVNLNEIKAKSNKEKIVVIEMTIEVKNLEDLNTAMRKFGKVDSVYDVRRKK